MKKSFSIQKKFILIFGSLILISGIVLAITAIQIAKKAVTEKINVYLLDKAVDMAAVFDGKLEALFQILETLARSPILHDDTLSYTQKAFLLEKDIVINKAISSFGVCDLEGIRYNPDGGRGCCPTLHRRGSAQECFDCAYGFDGTSLRCRGRISQLFL